MLTKEEFLELLLVLVLFGFNWEISNCSLFFFRSILKEESWPALLNLIYLIKVKLIGAYLNCPSSK